MDAPMVFVGSPGWEREVDVRGKIVVTLVQYSEWKIPANRCWLLLPAGAVGLLGIDNLATLEPRRWPVRNAQAGRGSPDNQPRPTRVWSWRLILPSPNFPGGGPVVNSEGRKLSEVAPERRACANARCWIPHYGAIMRDIRDARVALPLPAPERTVDDFFRAFTDEWMRSTPTWRRSGRYFTGAEQDAFERQIEPGPCSIAMPNARLVRKGLQELRSFDRATHD